MKYTEKEKCFKPLWASCHWEEWPYYSSFSRIKHMAYAEILHPIILPDRYFTSAFSNMFIKICSWLYSQIFLKQSEKKYISGVNKAKERFFSFYHFSFIFTQQQDKTLYNKGFLITAYHTFNTSQLHTQEHRSYSSIYLLPPQLFPDDLWPHLESDHNRMKEIT